MDQTTANGTPHFSSSSSITVREDFADLYDRDVLELDDLYFRDYYGSGDPFSAWAASSSKRKQKGKSLEMDTISEKSAAPSKRFGIKKMASVKKPTSERKSTSSDRGSDGENTDDPLGHLPAHEREILLRQTEIPTVVVNYRTLYRYATRNDMIIFTISVFSAIAAGALVPLMTVVFGSLTHTFQDYALLQITKSHFLSTLGHYTLVFLYLGIAEFITVYVYTVGFMYTGEHITQKIREEYLAAILRQNIGFFDKLGAGEITTRITADTNLVQEGISEKIGLTLTALSTFITAFIIGFAKYWLLTLIMCSTIVAIVLWMGAFSSQIVKNSRASLHAYAEGGTVADEVISSIRNATAFGTQDKLARQYDSHLVIAAKFSFRHQAILGFMFGGVMFVAYSNYALAFWQGSRFYTDGKVNVSDVVTILLAIMIGAFALGNIGPNAEAFTTSLAAAGKIFNTIDRVSPLDPASSEGLVLSKLEGEVELKNVRHIYPSRPEVVVMESVSLKVPAGKTTALVGASGSGKSTIVGLVERFYDPVGGQVLLDGHDLRDLNLRFVRQNISLVSQEPTLFGTTIYGNIAHGLIGTEYENADIEKKRELIVEAAKMANAHEFIVMLPDKYDTQVGERGFLLSGGQKQRIAIARAIVSDPKILLLDEATSALDTKSEGVVQAALDRASQGRTTITIAHRLSTIKDADNIIVMKEGRIIEQGTHNQLLAMRGAYCKLVEAQKILKEKTEEEQREDDEVSLAMLEKRYSSAQSFKDDRSSHGSVYYSAADQGQSSARPYSQRIERIDSSRPYSTRMDSSYSQKSVRVRISKPDMVNDPARQSQYVNDLLVEAVAQEEQDPKYGLWTLIRFIANFNREEWKLMIVGLCFSVIAGGGLPVQAVFFAKCIISLAKPPSEYDQVRSGIDYWTGMYFMLACSQFISVAGHGIVFAKCSERLIHRVRDRAFRAMLRQDIGYFDREEHSAGALTSFLSTESTHIAGLSGSTLGTLLNVTTTLVAGCALSLAIGWKLALVCISTVPLLLLCGFLQCWLLARFQMRAKKAYEQSAAYASENVSAIRTVASLTREQAVWNSYHEKLVAQGKASLSSILKSSSLYAASQAIMFLCMALGFWYGGKLIADRDYNLQQFFICFNAVTFGAQSAGTVFSFAPDMGKARNAAASLKKLFDRKPPIDSWSQDGVPVHDVDGEIRFSNVHFRYPTRPDQPVLRGLNLVIRPGQYVALVGASGCGKSTTIGLLERFYDPVMGGVYIDGRDISQLNINEYRKHLALVSQEPTLYQGTIKENILLGADNFNVSDEDIVQVCKDANIYNFIMSLPDGFSTVVGNKGVMLSGGQKQRVAIARALLRNPKILLLDEATSALDSESEKIVQAALDNAARGRTTVAVAHRLSTIQNADCIFVFDQGKVVEQGTHNELMRKRGRYFELVELQSLEKH